MAAALSRVNNCLPFFPEGTAGSKMSETELIGLLEWALPTSLRKIFDKESFVPWMNSYKELIDECKRIKRTETPRNNNNNDDNDNNKNTEKSLLHLL